MTIKLFIIHKNTTVKLELKELPQTVNVPSRILQKM